MIKVEINEQKCKSPRDCHKCLEVCPEGVFMNYPRDGRAPGKRAADWVIVPVMLSFCTGCRYCEQACPEEAVTVYISA